MKYTYHVYVLAGGITILFVTVCYGFFYNHKEYIIDDDDRDWVNAFSRNKMTKDNIKNISHDEDTWYYNNFSTCVGYGDWEDKCPRHEVVCGGGKKMGDRKSQVDAVITAINNGGVHPDCPLLYPGTS